MNVRCLSIAIYVALPLFLSAARGDATAAKSEIKGAAILKHACGKMTIKHMGLVHAGKVDEAVSLGTKDMQEQWKAMPLEDRQMLTGMMKEMSVTSAEFAADIQANGLLVVEGADVTLTVKQEKQDAEGTSTSTMTQRFKIDAGGCRISP